MPKPDFEPTDLGIIDPPDFTLEDLRELGVTEDKLTGRAVHGGHIPMAETVELGCQLPTHVENFLKIVVPRAVELTPYFSPDKHLFVFNIFHYQPRSGKYEGMPYVQSQWHKDDKILFTSSSLDPTEIALQGIDPREPGPYNGFIAQPNQVIMVDGNSYHRSVNPVEGKNHPRIFNAGEVMTIPELDRKLSQRRSADYS